MLKTYRREQLEIEFTHPQGFMENTALGIDTSTDVSVLFC